MCADTQLRLCSAYASHDPYVREALPSQNVLRVLRDDQNAYQGPNGTFLLVRADPFQTARLAYVQDGLGEGMGMGMGTDPTHDLVALPPSPRTEVGVVGGGGGGGNEADVRRGGAMARDTGALQNVVDDGVRRVALVHRHAPSQESRDDGVGDGGDDAYGDDASMSEGEGEWGGQLHQREFESRWIQSTACRE